MMINRTQLLNSSAGRPDTAALTAADAAHVRARLPISASWAGNRFDGYRHGLRAGLAICRISVFCGMSDWREEAWRLTASLSGYEQPHREWVLRPFAYTNPLHGGYPKAPDVGLGKGRCVGGKAALQGGHHGSGAERPGT